MKCRLEWCDKPGKTRGLCSRHYKQDLVGRLEAAPPTCAQCEGPIVGRYSNAKFCGVPCQMKLYRREGCYTKDALLKSVGACKIDGCEEPVRARGYCNSHNIRFLRHGDPMGGNFKTEGCQSPDCDKPHFGRGYCHKHYFLDHYYRNQDQRRAYLNARRTYLKKATPPWADLAEIERIYAQCPEGNHVDHVIPLRGRNVCGLHVAANLQYLPARENARKSNRWQGVAGPNRSAVAC